MAIYKRMSVAAGGGVIDNLYKAQMADALNICIGLGGTGADMIKALKKKFIVISDRMMNRQQSPTIIIFNF